MFLHHWLRRLLALRRSRALDHETRAEMEAHIRLETESLLRGGMEARAARRAARLAFGDVQRFREEARDARRVSGLEDLLQDLRFGVRALRRAPGFTLAAVLTLALGMGANTAIFSVVNGVLLRPLPFPGEGRLVRAWGNSRAEFTGVAERATAFTGVAAYTEGAGLGLSGAGEPVRVAGAEVTPGLFAVLGVKPALGRGFAATEAQPGADGVVVLSDGLWRERFGADAGLLGRSIDLDGRPRLVIGIMPPGFAFPGHDTRLWIPVLIDAAQRGVYWGSGGLHVVARLRQGVTAAQARAELRSVAARLRLENPVWTPSEESYLAAVNVVPLRDSLVSASRPLLLLLLGAAGMVLLIACANVANLLLVRGSARTREMAVRAALGAARSRLLRQLVTENLLLSALGALAGLALALAGRGLLLSLLPPDTPRLAEVRLDPRVLGFALASALLTGVIFGFAPALRALRGTVGGALSGARGEAGGTRAGRRLLGALAAAEVAVAAVLVIGATLLLRTLWQLQQVNPGFEADHLLSARIDLPATRYDSDDRRLAVWSQLVTQLDAVPGVQSAAATSQVPFDQVADYIAMYVDGWTRDPNALDFMDVRRITPGYLKTMGVPLLRGRNFDDADGAGARLVALIDERAVQQFFQGRDPIGGRIRFPWRSEWMTVVGVVGSVVNNDLAGEQRPAFYIPLAQQTPAAVIVVARTREPGATTQALRTIADRLAPDAPVSDVRTLGQRMSALVARPRSAAALLGAFAAVALLLGAVGTYGVMAWVTGRRTRELALRMALGAHAGEVVRLVVREGVMLAAGGALAGSALGLVLTRLLRGLLYGISATDPLTFVAAPLLLASVGVLASWLPAWRAARVQPMTALRSE